MTPARKQFSDMEVYKTSIEKAMREYPVAFALMDVQCMPRTGSTAADAVRKDVRGVVERLSALDSSDDRALVAAAREASVQGVLKHLVRTGAVDKRVRVWAFDVKNPFPLTQDIHQLVVDAIVQVMVELIDLIDSIDLDRYCDLLQHYRTVNKLCRELEREAAKTREPSWELEGFMESLRD